MKRLEDLNPREVLDLLMSKKSKKAMLRTLRRVKKAKEAKEARAALSKNVLLMLLCLMMVLAPGPAWATVVNAPEPFYIYTSMPNTVLVASSYLLANSQANDGTLFTEITVSWEVQSGDIVEIRWWDKYGNAMPTTTLDTSSTSQRAVSVTPPSGAYAAKLVLRTGSTEGDRYAWWHSATNTNNITTIFPDPELAGGGGSTGGSVPSGGTGTTVIVDNSDVVSALNEVKSQLSSISSDVNGHFNAVRGKLDDVIGKLGDLNDYLMTPRVPEPFDTTLPQVSFDPTPPTIEEPYMQPYAYNRPAPAIPPPTDTSGPLPYAPDPEHLVMAHDPPAQVEQPLEKDDPIARNTPLQRDPVVKDDPLPRDPVNMDPPLQRDLVARDDPLPRDNPVSREEPIGREAL
ncbi:MAG: hypothetical protein QHH75_11860 [Bacillota bacterium]|nr:hypothetical protein [Bacillota bacterium]